MKLKFIGIILLLSIGLFSCLTTIKNDGSNDSFEISAKDLNDSFELFNPDFFKEHKKQNADDIPINKLYIDGDNSLIIAWTNDLYAFGILSVFSLDNKPVFFDQFYEKIISVSHEHYINDITEQYDDFIIIKHSNAFMDIYIENVTIYHVEGTTLKKLDSYIVTEEGSMRSITIDNKEYTERACQNNGYNLFSDSKELLGLVFHKKEFIKQKEIDGTDIKYKNIIESSTYYLWDSNEKKFIETMK